MIKAFQHSPSKLQNGLQILGLLTLSLVVGSWTTPYMGLATASYFIMVCGLLSLKSAPSTHPKYMMTAMGLDLVLVLTLEFQRDAIKTAAAFELSVFQQLHILFSLMAVLLYFPVFYYGYKRWKWTANATQIKAHKFMGIAAFALRSLGFAFMFSLIK